MRERRIGERHVSAIGLGGMPMSIEGRPDRERSIATIHAALDAGLTLIDTADAYHRDAGEVGHNELLIAEALASYGGSTDHVLVATKGGSKRPGDGTWTHDGDPAYIASAARASLTRLGVDSIGLYQHHRPDPKVPYADTLGALRTLLDEGLIQMAGISNANPEQIRLAREIVGDGLVSVQNQFSPVFRTSLAELELCTELGLAFLAWSPLGGIRGTAGLGGRVPAFARIGERHDASPQQVALAWELSLSDAVIPIPGASRPESVARSVAALELRLDADEIAELSASVPEEER
ncbi:aldo/keto reductase [Homoserinibacter sp. GY 40078]|uniref:aldo/keto reductase n=1 Tax=Homoserinibacter sp. GY 40078 TaxID=2603275 RepID=UPI0011C964A6|nr:aldo/keto reductase [Homoserinibacter sp. GY 40078]TXK19429.1 aldo/keto reductase [Homoserinibacter sp. GY 40078]